MKRALVNHAEAEGVDAAVFERRRVGDRAPVFGDDVDWIREHAPCDVIQIEDRGLGERTSLAVVTDRGPSDPVKVMIADALAQEAAAGIEFLLAVDPDASDHRRLDIHEYLEGLASLCASPVDVTLFDAEDRVDGIVRPARDANVLVANTSSGGVRGALLG